MVIFGENIYLWRVFKGLTQEELARKAGIHRPNLSAIESGKREVTLATLRLLAAAFGVSAGVLADGAPPPRFSGADLSRKSLENIIRIVLRKSVKYSTEQERNIGLMLFQVAGNMVNAKEKRYNNILKGRKAYLGRWLMLKAVLGRDILNSLLARLDKNMTVSNESKTD